jgi:hypothetical protein
VSLADIVEADQAEFSGTRTLHAGGLIYGRAGGRYRLREPARLNPPHLPPHSDRAACLAGHVLAGLYTMVLTSYGLAALVTSAKTAGSTATIWMVVEHVPANTLYLKPAEQFNGLACSHPLSVVAGGDAHGAATSQSGELPVKAGCDDTTAPDKTS